MSDEPRPIDWRTETTVPPEEYRAQTRRFNPGYDLGFTLVRSLLQAQQQSDMHTLVVGAGGGMEIEALLPENLGWRITGVDISPPMLAIAHQTVERMSLQDRATLHLGTVTDLPADAMFDAVTCAYVLFFLPDRPSKLELLSAIKQRLRPGGPFILIDAIFGRIGPFIQASMEYAVVMGATRDASETTIKGFAARAAASPFTEADEVALLTEAGFTSVERFFTTYATTGWIATCQ